jgi:hypothetical protein
MDEDFPFETMPFEVDPEAQGMSQSGRWFRQGRNIVLLLDNKTHSGDSEIYEVSTGGIPSRKDLIDPRIDFHAQEALYRMFKGDPGVRAAAAQIFAAVKSGQLGGIYAENQLIPATRAQRMGLGWWQLIPKGDDVAFVRDATNPSAAPIIIFRQQMRSVPARIDQALGMIWSRLRARPQEPVWLFNGPRLAGARTATVIPPCAGIREPCEILERFGFNKDDIGLSHLLQIDRITRCVIASKNTPQPILSMLVVGHASPEGSPEYNRGLGMRRAQNVIQKLKEAIRAHTQGTNLAGLADRIVFTSDSGGEEQPRSDNSTEDGRARNRRVEVCLPPLPIQPPLPEFKCEDVAARSLPLLETAPFPNEQKRRLRCVLAMVCDLSVDDRYINNDFIVRTLAKGIFPRLDPAAFATAVIKDRVRRDLLAAAQGSDDTLRDSLKLLDERILSGINLISDQIQRNSELNVNNPVLRQMQEFVSAQQRNQKSIYFCYGLGQK